MSLYKVHFLWKEKEVTLRAKCLDLTHPHFVSIKDIVFPDKKKLIIDPSEDEVLKTFGRADHLMIPFQRVQLIEEISKDEPSAPEKRVKPFTLVEKEDYSIDSGDPDGTTDNSPSN